MPPTSKRNSSAPLAPPRSFQTSTLALTKSSRSQVEPPLRSTCLQSSTQSTQSTMSPCSSLLLLVIFQDTFLHLRRPSKLMANWSLRSRRSSTVKSTVVDAADFSILCAGPVTKVQTKKLHGLPPMSLRTLKSLSRTSMPPTPLNLVQTPEFFFFSLFSSSLSFSVFFFCN